MAQIKFTFNGGNTRCIFNKSIHFLTFMWYGCRRAIKVPLSTPYGQIQFFTWTQDLPNLTQGWHCVLLSDESYFQLFQSNVRFCMWCKTSFDYGSWLSKRHQAVTSLMVWDVFMLNRFGLLVPLQCHWLVTTPLHCFIGVCTYSSISTTIGSIMHCDIGWAQVAQN